MAPTSEDRARIYVLALDADPEYKTALRRRDDLERELAVAKVEAQALTDRLNVMVAAMRGESAGAAHLCDPVRAGRVRLGSLDDRDSHRAFRVGTPQPGVRIALVHNGGLIAQWDQMVSGSRFTAYPHALSGAVELFPGARCDSRCTQRARRQ